MFIEVVILSLIAGIILKGSIRNIKEADLCYAELAIASFILEAVIVLLIRKGIIFNQTLLYILYLFTYILLFIFVYMNRKYSEVLVMGAGSLLNALAIFLNGGAMPVSKSAMIKAGMSNIADRISNEGLYKLLDDKTVMPFLCDIIPRPYPRPFVISIGDILIAAGLFFLVLRLMKCEILIKEDKK